jgi:two-component system alkaline phosphatase synthesis response regulator PhoP
MNKKKILLVDDDVDLIEQNKLLLEAREYVVITASNAEQGWQLFLKEKPDAAVVDLIMEEHDSGFILSYKIKKDKHGMNIPVYILTSATYLTGYKFGASTDEEKEWIRCDEIINKPVVIEDLIQKIENYYLTHNTEKVS